MTPLELRWTINLLEDGSVVTKDGEFLGTWVSDENDHPSFLPDGATEELFFDVYIWRLCERIEDWRKALSGR